MISLVPRAQWAVLELARCREGCYTAGVLANLRKHVGGGRVGGSAQSAGGSGGGSATTAGDGGNGEISATAPEAGINTRIDLVSPDGVVDGTKVTKFYVTELTRNIHATVCGITSAIQLDQLYLLMTSS